MFLFKFGVLLLLFQAGSSFVDYNGWINIELHHALEYSDPGIFTYRGNISLPNVNTGLSNVIQETLSISEKKSLKSLAKNKDLYRLKAVVIYSNGQKYDFLTSIKACDLILSQLNDVLWISIDGVGFITGVTEITTAGTNEACLETDSISRLRDFNTDVLISQTELAPIPDTASFIQKVEREREAREKGEVRDNRGFLAKYWMYIVPVVLLVFISGATNQDTTK